MKDHVMSPEDIDYSLIDPPLRRLVKAINHSSWARTMGCCAGNACHEKGCFYLLVEVKGFEGVSRLLAWLSLSRELGLGAFLEGSRISAFALPDAEVVVPDNPAETATGALMGRGWVRFDVRIRAERSPSNGEQTRGGIKALELGWGALARSMGGYGLVPVSHWHNATVPGMRELFHEGHGGGA